MSANPENDLFDEKFEQWFGLKTDVEKSAQSPDGAELMNRVSGKQKQKPKGIKSGRPRKSDAIKLLKAFDPTRPAPVISIRGDVLQAGSVLGFADGNETRWFAITADTPITILNPIEESSNDE